MCELSSELHFQTAGNIEKDKENVYSGDHLPIDCQMSAKLHRYIIKHLMLLYIPLELMLCSCGHIVIVLSN